MATGGLVLVIMPMSDGTAEQQIAGLCQEMLDRLDAMGTAVHPEKKDLGSSDSRLVNYWKRYAFSVIEGKIRLSATVDPEALKCVLNDMVTEAQAKLLLHSLVTRAIVQQNEVQGVICESKSGRQAAGLSTPAQFSGCPGRTTSRHRTLISLTYYRGDYSTGIMI